MGAAKPLRHRMKSLAMAGHSPKQLLSLCITEPIIRQRMPGLRTVILERVAAQYILSETLSRSGSRIRGFLFWWSIS